MTDMVPKGTEEHRVESLVRRESANL